MCIGVLFGPRRKLEPAPKAKRPTKISVEVLAAANEHAFKFVGSVDKVGVREGLCGGGVESELDGVGEAEERMLERSDGVGHGLCLHCWTKACCEKG